MSPFLKRQEPSPEENRILEITRNAAVQLGMVNLNFDSISWTNFDTRSAKPALVDYPILIRHRLLLARELMELLSPDDWKPLIISELIFSKKLKPGLRRQATIKIALPLIFVALAEIAALILIPNQRAEYSPLAILFAIAGGVMLVLGQRRYSPKVKKARLHADLETASLTGKDNFLRVLRKIDDQGLRAVTRFKNSRFARNFADRPDMTERITSLEQESPGYSFG
jgi:hypothetical protein